MPHKRAKRSIREQQRSQKGADLAPSRGDALSSEPLPKGLARALNAVQVRADFRAKRKQAGGGEDGGAPRKKRRKVDGDGGEKGEAQRILPGETLAHFNKRVETNMRPLVRSAVQSSLATTRAAARKPTAAATTKSTPDPTKSKSTSKSAAKSNVKLTAPEPPPDKHATRPKEFAHTSSAAPRRLNDIALAPPDLSAPTRRAASNSTSSKTSAGGTPGASTKASILSPAQRLHMAAARDAAVAHYRALKAARRAEWDGGERGAGWRTRVRGTRVSRLRVWGGWGKASSEEGSEGGEGCAGR
ncbi:hypothetical protein B0H10DRAFT_1799678 [Mycena sp. CBHHK59/15]|nr:hypothetical protein B0H10DRAFT_1799678 [Mycena sp. CBHHK59/15]